MNLLSFRNASQHVMHGASPHAERALQIVSVQEVLGNSSAGFSFVRLFSGAFCHA